MLPYTQSDRPKGLPYKRSFTVYSGNLDIRLTELADLYDSKPSVRSCQTLSIDMSQ